MRISFMLPMIALGCLVLSATAVLGQGGAGGSAGGGGGSGAAAAGGSTTGAPGASGNTSSATGVPGASGNASSAQGVLGASGNTSMNGVPGTSANVPSANTLPNGTGSLPMINNPSAAGGTFEGQQDGAAANVRFGTGRTGSLPAPAANAIRNQPNDALNARQSGGADARIDILQNNRFNGNDRMEPFDVLSNRQGGPAVRRDQRQDARQAQTQTAQPNDWRLSYYNNEWWHWTPQNTWMYYRDNNWTRYDANGYVPYTAGHRGTLNRNESGSFYVDENGRRYRREYSPDYRTLRGRNSGDAELQMTQPRGAAESNSATQFEASRATMGSTGSNPIAANGVSGESSTIRTAENGMIPNRTLENGSLPNRTPENGAPNSTPANGSVPNPAPANGSASRSAAPSGPVSR